MARFSRFYKLTNGKIYGKRIFPNTKIARLDRFIIGNIWRDIYRFIFK